MEEADRQTYREKEKPQDSERPMEGKRWSDSDIQMEQKTDKVVETPSESRIKTERHIDRP